MSLGPRRDRVSIPMARCRKLRQRGPCTCDNLPHHDLQDLPEVRGQVHGRPVVLVSRAKKVTEVLANLVCDLPQVQRSGGCINKQKTTPRKTPLRKNAGRLLMQWLTRWTCQLTAMISSLAIFWLVSTTGR